MGFFSKKTFLLVLLSGMQLAHGQMNNKDIYRNEHSLQKEPTQDKSRIDSGKILKNALSAADELNNEVGYLKKTQSELEEILVSKLQSGDTEGLQDLLDAYSKTTRYDSSLIMWGEALISAKQLNFDQSIKIYAKLTYDFPKLNILRYQYATILYISGQIVEAKEQLTILHEQVKGAFLTIVENALEGITKAEQLHADLSLSYASSDNINNVAPKGSKLKVSLFGAPGYLYPDPAESAHGLSYNFSLSKQHFLPKHFYISSNISSDGTVYIDNFKYSLISGKLTAGLGYHNAKTDITVMPYLKNTWYANAGDNKKKFHQYYFTPGVNISLNQLISPQWNWYGNLDLGKDFFDNKDDKRLDGYNVAFSNTFSYQQSLNRGVNFGFDVSRKNAVDPTLSSNRYGVSLGWSQVWPKAFVTNLSLSYHHKVSDKPQQIFGTEVKNINDEYRVQLSLVNSKISFFGITPRLVWSFRDNKSTNPLNKLKNNDVYIDFKKQF